MTTARIQKRTAQASKQKTPKNDDVQFQQQVEEPRLDLLTETDCLEERHQKILKIEQDVAEIADLYKSVQQLVNEQQPQINAIEESISSAKKKTEEGQEELEKADRYLRNRCVIL